jgi:hypothetical protein
MTACKCLPSASLRLAGTRRFDSDYVVRCAQWSCCLQVEKDCLCTDLFDSSVSGSQVCVQSPVQSCRASHCARRCVPVQPRVTAIVASIAAASEDVPAAAVSASDAAWLVETASAGPDAAVARAAWDAIAAVCCLGDATTSRARMVAAHALTVATTTLRRPSVPDDVVAACLRAVAYISGGIAFYTTRLPVRDPSVGTTLGRSVVGAVLHAMRRAARSAAVAARGCLVLWCFSYAVRARGGEESIGGEGVTAVMEAMLLHADSTSVQEHGLGMVEAVPWSDDEWDALADARGGPVLTALRQHARVVAVQARGCGALSNVTRGETDAITCGEPVVVGLVVKAMQRYANVAAVQERGCLALSNFAATNGDRDRIAAAGGVDLVLAALLRHADHSGVQQVGELALGRFLVRTDKSTRAAASIVGAGGIDALLMAMECHTDSVAVQANSCLVLGNLGNASHHVALDRAIILPAVAAAMRRHIDAVAVQQYGSLAMQNLAPTADNWLRMESLGIATLVSEEEERGTDLGIDEEEQLEAMDASGGITAVVAAMQHHAAVYDLQVHCCAALEMMGRRCRENVEEMARVGAIETVLAALRRFPRDVDMQVHGCGALRVLALAEENLVIIGDAGGVDVVLDALRCHINVRDVQMVALGALMNLAYLPENGEAIAEARGFETVFATMRRYGDSADIALRGVMFLTYFFSYGSVSSDRLEVVIPAMVDAGGIKMVLAAMRRYPDFLGVLQCGCRTLWGLCTHAEIVEATVDAIAREGGVQIVLAAMRRYPDEPPLQQQGCGLLSMLVGNPAAKTAIIRAGGRDVVLAAQERFRILGANALLRALR